MIAGFVLAVVLSQSALDAPVLDKTRLYDVRVVEKGEAAPERGLWMDEKAAIATANELQTLRQRPEVSHLIAAAVMGLCAGAAIGVASYVALRR